jgi:hypothetical protein
MAKTLNKIVTDSFPEATAYQTKVKPGPTAGFNKRQLQLTKVMMEHPDSEKVIHPIFEAALDNEHRNQGLAWKLIVDRQIPMDYLEKAKGGNHVNAIIEGVKPLSGVTIDGKAERDADNA